MARKDVPLLDTNNPFPRLTMDSVGGGPIALPDHFQGRYGVLLVYRGSW
jgi:hypothetical protein